MTDLLALADWAWGFGVLGLIAAAGAYVVLGRRPSGIAGMEQLGDRIRAGAARVLRRGSIVLAAAAALGAVALFAASGRLAPAAAFVGGAASSALAAWLGVLAATRANVRSAAAAHEGSSAAALRVALAGGAVSGVAVASLAVTGLGALYFGLGSTAVAAPDRQRFGQAVAAFALGAGIAALWGRVGGGIFAKSADLAARRGRGDPRDAATLADQVGDNVGDVAGVGSDLLESTVAAVGATIVIAGGSAADLAPAAALPLLALVAGLLASVIGMVLVPLLARASAAGTLRGAATVATLVFVALTLLVVRALGLQGSDAAGRAFAWWTPWAALSIGSAAGLLVAFATEYHTAARPLRRVAEAARDGAAAALMVGAAVGLESAVLPALLVGATVWATTSLAGLYGLGLGAVGMLATVGVTQSIAAYGAITDNASAIGTLSGLPRDARATSDSLGAVGNTTAAVGKGVASAAASLTGLALVGAVALATGATLTGPRAPGPFVLAGLLLGAMLPFLAASLALGGVLRAVRRALRVGPDETDSSGDARCLDRLGRSALRETTGPALLALLTPPVVGWLGGVSGLVGLLLGVAISGGLLALFLANSGGVWDNAARFIAGGAHGGRGSPAHQAAAVAETLGDPFKDSCAPALSSLIKLMGVLALVLAPWLATL